MSSSPSFWPMVSSAGQELLAEARRSRRGSVMRALVTASFLPVGTQLLDAAAETILAVQLVVEARLEGDLEARPPTLHFFTSLVARRKLQLAFSLAQELRRLRRRVHQVHARLYLVFGSSAPFGTKESSPAPSSGGRTSAPPPYRSRRRAARASAQLLIDRTGCQSGELSSNFTSSGVLTGATSWRPDLPDRVAVVRR